MPPKKTTLAVPASGVPEEVQGRRALGLPTYLQRILPFYGHPDWMQGDRWRAFVYNQPICGICRDTLINNLEAKEWDLRAREVKDESVPAVKQAINYYTDLISNLEGDLDNFLEIMGRDLYDLPMGMVAEIGREDDKPGAPVVYVDHIDAATLFPTYVPDYPIAQMIPELPTRPQIFPAHAVQKAQISPRPELRRKGWGMAPPEKAYLAVQVLYTGDRYYWQMLLDTPEAGIIDLIDMDKLSAEQWVAGFRSMFEGVDPFKIPILYGHDKPAQWIPLNRPPIDLQYDKAIDHYAQIVCAAYGLRTSDIGLEEGGPAGTLAGVIRAERQSKRSGYAVASEKFRNFFDHILPKEIRFKWVETDVEETVGRGRAMLAVSQALTTAIAGSLIDQAEGRAELVAQGLFKTEIDPMKVIGGAVPGAAGGQPGNLGNVLNTLLGRKPGAPAGALQDQGLAPGQDKVSPSQGGRGEQSKPEGMLGRVFRRRAKPNRPEVEPPSREELIARMNAITGGVFEDLMARASEIRLKRLVRGVTRAMVPAVAETLRSLSDEEVSEVWLPEMEAFSFGQPSVIEDEIIIRQEGEFERVVDERMAGDPWWEMLDDWNRADVLEVLRQAYRRGVIEQAIAIVRALYEEGLADSPALVGLSFELTNPATLRILSEAAAEMVRNVDEGTKYYLRRLIIGGVRHGISNPRIADAIRNGALADDILADEAFVSDALETVRNGLQAMSEYRRQSIVNTEIAMAENGGKLAQMTFSGFHTKAWQHLGPRGVTDKGNVHPCELCAANEELGFVPIDFMYRTVFGEAESPIPPGHPGECHCGIGFNPEELATLVAAGAYRPWTGD